MIAPLEQKKQILEAMGQAEEGNITNALRVSNGWGSQFNENPCKIFHEKLKDSLFDKAYSFLDEKNKKEICKKLNHETHFQEGVSRSTAMEYYYFSGDARFKKGYIVGLEGGSVRMTNAMKEYHRAIKKAVRSYKMDESTRTSKDQCVSAIDLFIKRSSSEGDL